MDRVCPIAVLAMGGFTAAAIAADRHRDGLRVGRSAATIELTELRAAKSWAACCGLSSLANDHGAYAVTIVGDSMWPRFRPGRRVAVSPKAPIAIGDDVLVKLK